MKQTRFNTTALLAAAIVFAGLAPARASAPQNGFSLRSLDGGTVSSASLNGKVVVLAVAASWLPLTRQQAAGVAKIAADYGGRGVVVYWVFTDSENAKSKNFATDEQLKAFATRNGISLRVLRDPDGATVKHFDVTQVPAFVILNRSGSTAGAPIEGIDPEGDLSDTLGQRLQGLL
jgi:cytochrome c biogenesis protein CcmG/thiol:disulfide interchange protein DsbE